jgi:predicted enzyme related to lactoylglutathione lyase
MVFAGPIPIADLGIMAVVADQSGATFGLWQPGTFPGFPLSGDVGTPLWFELYTKDYDGSKRFFTEVFSWTFDTVSDTPEFAYSTVSFNGEPKVGIMDFSAPVHDAMAGYWNAYVRVGDCDEAARAVEHAGGTVLMSPTDSPFGRMASVRDRDGSVFSLMQALG